MKKYEKYGIFVHPGKELTTPRWLVDVTTWFCYTFDKFVCNQRSRLNKQLEIVRDILD